AAQAAVVTTLEGVLEHVTLHAFRCLHLVQPRFVYVGVACGAAAGAAAIGRQARHAGERGGLHDRLADFAVDLMVGAVMFDKGQCGHVLLRFLWAQEWLGKGCASKRGTRPRVSSNSGPTT